jgi:hypothetical protein
LRLAEETSVIERTFDLASFHAKIGATAKERGPLRQDLVRGLKDYFEARYGYDRYGAETIFHLEEYLGQPYIYGFTALRILHDRRISDCTKIAVAERALDVAEYGADLGLPFGFFSCLDFLAKHGRLSAMDLRYALVVSAGEQTPFHGMEKADSVDFFARLLNNPELPAAERAFWGHSLLARHGDQAGSAALIDLLLGSEGLGVGDRAELCRAWINFRQPRITVDIPASTGNVWGDFVADHMGFWVAHAPSRPTPQMVRSGLVWLARLEEDPLHLATTYIGQRDVYSEQFHGAVAEIIAEHHRTMPEGKVRTLIEQGISISGSSPTRRRFYRLGTELFGPEYLHRATVDTASSVRQWAEKQLQKSR